MKIFDYFYYIFAFVLGVVVTMVIYSAIYALGMPKLVLVLAVALLAIVLCGGTGFALGARRAKEMCKIARSEGVSQGIRLGRAERQSEIQNFLEVK